MAERLNNSNFKEKALQETRLTLIDFYSDSCVPCKRMSPVLAELEAAYEDKLYIGKVNIAYDRDLAEKYSVMSTPTLIFFKDGEPVETLTGVRKKAELEQIMKELIQEVK